MLFLAQRELFLGPIKIKSFMKRNIYMFNTTPICPTAPQPLMPSWFLPLTCRGGRSFIPMICFFRGGDHHSNLWTFVLFYQGTIIAASFEKATGIDRIGMPGCRWRGKTVGSMRAQDRDDDSRPFLEKGAWQRNI